MRWKLWLAVFRLTSSVLWAVSVSCPQPRRKPVLLMAQARPGAPPPLEYPSNRPPTACGSYKRRDQTMIAGETRPAELETPVIFGKEGKDGRVFCRHARCDWQADWHTQGREYGLGFREGLRPQRQPP